MSTYEAFRQEVFRLALENGCTAAETYKTEGENFSVNILSQEIDQYEVSRTLGIGLRVQLDGKDGYAYTESMDDAASLVQHAMDNARSVENTGEHPMQGPQTYTALPVAEDPLMALSDSDRIQLAMQLEKETLAHGEPVDRCSTCALEVGKKKVSLHNTLGLSAEETRQYSVMVVSPIVRRGDEVQDAYAFSCGSTDTAALANEAVKKSTARLGAQPVAPGKTRILLHGDAVATLLQAFAPIFSADQVQKGLSPLKDSRQETVASPLITLVDDPFEPGMPMTFDDEGTPSQKTVLIQNGTLTGFLHNLKTAAKEPGAVSTGNGRRAGAASPVTVAPTNLFITPGTDSFDQLVEKLGNGLIITDMTGIHAGVNDVAGSFSLLSSGFLVENGVITRAVDRITVAGSFIDMLKDVTDVGADLTFSLPGVSRYGAPSLLVRQLTVAGS